MISHKNILLEFCQKNKIPLIFDTKRIGGTDHNPLWKSTTNFQGIFFETQNSFQSKVQAEQELSILILNDIENKNKNKTKKILSKNILLIIDLENSKNYEFLSDYENLEIIGICSRNFPIKENLKINTKVVESTSKDAADIAIIMYITKLIIERLSETSPTILLLTKDHFGKTFEECISSKIFNFENIEFKHCLTENEVNNFLEKY